MFCVLIDWICLVYDFGLEVFVVNVDEIYIVLGGIVSLVVFYSCDEFMIEFVWRFINF